MIAEPVLNGLLHLFALAAAPLRGEAREAARRRTLDYLNNHVGLADAGVYIGLYQDLAELHAIGDEADRLRAAGEIVASLKTQLGGEERYAAVLCVLELAAVSAGSDWPGRMAEWLGRELDLAEEAGRMRAFLTCPPGADGRWMGGGTAGFRGRLAVLKLRGDDLFLAAATGDEPVWLEGHPLAPGAARLLCPGQVLRDRWGNELHYAAVAAAFREEGAGPVLDFRGARLEYRFADGRCGLHDFSFAERGGRLVGIMGASGAGKSTLLEILNGTLRPSSGDVRLNGRDIHAGAGEGVIGFVPQDDMLFEDLTVYENLYYAARLCLAHLPEARRIARVRRMLADLGQADIADLKVGSPLQKTISGGQRKRLNIALELIREPTVLFVDEPTSGLSSADSETVMSLLKEQAAGGRLVFAVVHQPSSKIFRMFDALWILDQGGWPVFTGAPVEAVAYFRAHGNLPGAWESICPGCGSVNPEQIFDILEARTLGPAGRATPRRRVPPEQWHERYRDYEAERARPAAPVPPAELPPPAPSLHRPGRLGQLAVFFVRDVRARLASLSYLLVALLEPPVLGLLTGLVSRGAFGGTYSFHENNNVHVFFFMSVIVAVFLGLSVSAEEICRDARILRRERFLHLSWWSYVHSKTLYLALVCALQMALFVSVAFPIVGVPGLLVRGWAALFLCAFCSGLLGLNISASFRSAVTIYILIPLLIVPQMLLCGVVIPYDDLIAPRSRAREVPWFANLMPPRWGYEALVVEQYLHNAYQRNLAGADARLRLAEFDLDHYLPELLGLVQSIPLLREEGRAGDLAAKQRILTNELARLEQRMGTAAGAAPAVSGPDLLDDAGRARVEEYLAACRKTVFEQRRAAAADKRAILDRLEAELGPEGLERLKRRHTSRSIEKQALNLQDFRPVGEAEDGLFRRTLPVYQVPESCWGGAHFLAGSKRWGGRLRATYAFNLAAIAALSFGLYGLLGLRVLPRLLRNR
ncbi:MAG TPA: ATP-binding cassette domain-containing protein [Kiritimatiellia bacterium]|nr:ATP-binding cassette domain-containing protein [Kiritimatiellia bacterium]HRZ12220.1 ATP-binding cassette domain-containing protein [Kiritimatiellia bacterium]HSA18022.1 ATP-binding cassette domain-containing protein [Kiritimatiellia bacterium]